MSEAMHLLRAVTQPLRPAPGRLRRATSDDRERLIEWERAFVLEASIGEPSHAARVVDRRLFAGRQFVWEHGRPLATVGVNAAINGTARVGPVYTPPEHRRRGYATSAVAAASELLLGSGARWCMLLTDLANPTSNKIYASIGYERFGDWEEHVFSRAPRSPGG